ncbi:MAG: hypothetical protein GY832_23785 [Chloroflexi bacterium]|nr:hypothetical protein [Chloroflexota bacterium]
MNKMEKIACLLVRDFDKPNTMCSDEINRECQWVVDGEGIPTIKWDGTAVMFRDGDFFKRRMVRKDKHEPKGFEVCTKDERTGKRFGWIPVDEDPTNVHHRKALEVHGFQPDGTYELCGPKVQGNPQGLSDIQFMKHGAAVVEDPPVEFTIAALAAWFESHDMEGVVWWHKDGRKCKIRAGDVGVKWPHLIND